MSGPRFLAVIDPFQTDSAIDAIAAARSRFGYSIVHDHPRLVVLAPREAPVRPSGGDGVIIGTLFGHGSSSVVAEHGDGIEASSRRVLIDHCWGDYVSLVTSSTSAAVATLRAPSGRLHAYRVRQGSVTYLASHVDILLGLGLVRAAIDWDFVAHHLTFAHLPTDRTGLCGVDELMPGDCTVEYGRRFETECLWSPWTFASAERRIDSFAEAVRRVHEAVVTSVSTLTQGCEKVLLELSGGLDSSVVAAALAEAGRSVVALNLATSGMEGDERRYARQVSEHCGIPLMEAIAEDAIDLTAPVRRLTARPAIPAMLSVVDARFEAAARDNAVSAFVSGMGGDCVFCSLGTAAPAADGWISMGMRPRSIAVLRDVARVHDVDVWTAGRLMLRQLARRRKRAPWRRHDRFLRRDLLPRNPQRHPWLVGLEDAPPGSGAHIQSILAAHAHLDDYGRHDAAPSLFPLLTQPVVEACLTIPSWLWVEGGRDRAVARSAFAASLPRTITDRRTKGGMEAFCARTFDMNRERLKPFLLEGLLASAGLLDRVEIEQYLARPFGNRDAQFYLLLPIVDAEAWARGVVGCSL